MTTPDDHATAAAWVRDVAEPVARRLAAEAPAAAGSPPGAAPPPAAVPTRRHQAHTALDLLLDLATVAARLAGEVVVEASRAARAVLASEETPPGVLTFGQVAPGRTVEAFLELANTSSQPFDAVRLTCDGLLGPGRERIFAQRVSFEPPLLDVQPGSTVTIKVRVAVPRSTRRGGYIGVIDVDGRPEVRTLVTLAVL